MALIGIIGAMEVETNALIGEMAGAEAKTISGITFHKGLLCGCEAVVATCGIGKAFSAICAQTMILLYHPDFIVNIGVAGTLTSALGIGHIAVATDVVEHDMDTSAIGDPVGLISGINLIHLPCDPLLGRAILEAAGELGIPAIAGTIASGDQFVSDGSVKETIAERFSAIACEMESGGIAQACYIAGVPCAVIRSISDTADGDSADYEKFKYEAAEQAEALLKKVLAGIPME